MVFFFSFQKKGIFSSGREEKKQSFVNIYPLEAQEIEVRNPGGRKCPFGEIDYKEFINKKEMSISLSDWTFIMALGEFPAPCAPFMGTDFYFFVTTNDKDGIKFAVCPLFPGDITAYKAYLKSSGEVIITTKPVYMHNKRLYDILNAIIPPLNDPSREKEYDYYKELYDDLHKKLSQSDEKIHDLDRDIYDVLHEMISHPEKQKKIDLNENTELFPIEKIEHTEPKYPPVIQWVQNRYDDFVDWIESRYYEATNP